MLKKLTRILPFLIATLLAVGGVELFYRLLEHYLLQPSAEREVKSGEPAGLDRSSATMERHQNYDVIVERNLFRSYTEDEDQPQVEIEENPLAGLETTALDLVLLGTITGEAGTSRAIILDKTERSQEIYYQGDVIEGAEIKEILRGKVILSYGGKDEILDMSEAASMRPNIPDVTPSSFENEVFTPPPPPEFNDPDIDPAAMEPTEEGFIQEVEQNLEPEPLEYPENGVQEPGQTAEEDIENGTSEVEEKEGGDLESSGNRANPRRRVITSESAASEG